MNEEDVVGVDVEDNRLGDEAITEETGIVPDDPAADEGIEELPGGLEAAPDELGD